MGSSSAGLSLIGVGVTAGTTWRDTECVRRLTARELAQTLGDREAAKEVLCGAADVFRVYAALGRPCRLKPDGKANSDFAEADGGPLLSLRGPRPSVMTPAASVPTVALASLASAPATAPASPPVATIVVAPHVYAFLPAEAIGGAGPRPILVLTPPEQKVASLGSDRLPALTPVFTASAVAPVVSRTQAPPAAVAGAYAVASLAPLAIPQPPAGPGVPKPRPAKVQPSPFTMKPIPNPPQDKS